jgi:hypothetical protein
MLLISGTVLVYLVVYFLFHQCFNGDLEVVKVVLEESTADVYVFVV